MRVMVVAQRNGISSPTCSTPEAPLRLYQSWPLLQATCTLILTGFCCWFESDSATAALAKNSLVALGNAASSQAPGQRSREMPALPALPAITSEASGSESTPSIPKWNRRARGVHRFARLKTPLSPLGTPKRSSALRAPLTRTAGSVELGCHPGGQSHADLLHQRSPHLQPQSSFATIRAP